MTSEPRETFHPCSPLSIPPLVPSPPKLPLSPPVLGTNSWNLPPVSCASLAVLKSLANFSCALRAFLSGFGQRSFLGKMPGKTLENGGPLAISPIYTLYSWHLTTETKPFPTKVEQWVGWLHHQTRSCWVLFPRMFFWCLSVRIQQDWNVACPDHPDGFGGNPCASTSQSTLKVPRIFNSKTWRLKSKVSFLMALRFSESSPVPSWQPPFFNSRMTFHWSLEFHGMLIAT